MCPVVLPMCMKGLCNAVRGQSRVRDKFQHRSIGLEDWPFARVGGLECECSVGPIKGHIGKVMRTLSYGHFEV